MKYPRLITPAPVSPRARALLLARNNEIAEEKEGRREDETAFEARRCAAGERAREPIPLSFFLGQRELGRTGIESTSHDAPRRSLLGVGIRVTNRPFNHEWLAASSHLALMAASCLGAPVAMR